MKTIVLLIALFLIVATEGKKTQQSNVFGQALSKKDAKTIRKQRALQRQRVAVVPEPVKRRLMDVQKVRRQLPDYGYHEEPTIEPTGEGIDATEPPYEEFVDDDAYAEGKGGKGYGYGKGGKGYGYGKGGKGYGYGKGGKGYGKGGMMGMMSGGKGKGGKGYGDGGKGYGKGGLYPTYDDAPYFDDAMLDDEVIGSDECQMVTFNETFVMPGPTAFVAPDTTDADIGTPELPGTVFITEQVDLFEIDGVTPITGSTVTGTCTRTTIGENGGGICQFVFIDEEGYTISVDGYLPNPLGGPLAISGGTGSMVGVFGQFDLFPVFDTNTTSDVFIGAVEYQVIADIGIIVCPP